ncbi:helix-turn-helix transcriptional regulator [Schinkia azotoformans]|nr:helix-turn-helix transcriptional regulator [Schinkia azotoformans]
MLIPKIDEIIKEKGYTKKFVAKGVGFSQQQLINICKGTSFTTTEKLFKLAKFLEKKVDDLYEYIEENDSTDNSK